jgi:hypothetical protein
MNFISEHKIWNIWYEESKFLFACGNKFCSGWNVVESQKLDWNCHLNPFSSITVPATWIVSIMRQKQNIVVLFVMKIAKLLDVYRNWYLSVKVSSLPTALVPNLQLVQPLFGCQQSLLKPRLNLALKKEFFWWSILTLPRIPALLLWVMAWSWLSLDSCIPICHYVQAGSYLKWGFTIRTTWKRFVWTKFT